jgi:hypothetical protein
VQLKQTDVVFHGIRAVYLAKPFAFHPSLSEIFLSNHLDMQGRQIGFGLTP